MIPNPHYMIQRSRVILYDLFKYSETILAYLNSLYPPQQNLWYRFLDDQFL